MQSTCFFVDAQQAAGPLPELAVPGASHIRRQAWKPSYFSSAHPVQTGQLSQDSLMRSVLPAIIHESCNTPSRHSFLKYANGIAAALFPALAQAQGQPPASSSKVDCPPDHADTEATEKMPESSLPLNERVGYAIVGLGRLTLARLLPALVRCKYSRLTALVSGDCAKAQKLARQYGLGNQAIYNYQDFDRIADNPDVQVVYIVLPNNMHANSRWHLMHQCGVLPVA
jgi:hypothetical protein